MAIDVKSFMKRVDDGTIGYNEMVEGFEYLIASQRIKTMPLKYRYMAEILVKCKVLKTNKEA